MEPLDPVARVPAGRSSATTSCPSRSTWTASPTGTWSCPRPESGFVRTFGVLRTDGQGWDVLRALTLWRGVGAQHEAHLARAQPR